MLTGGCLRSPLWSLWECYEVGRFGSRCTAFQENPAYFASRNMPKISGADYDD